VGNPVSLVGNDEMMKDGGAKEPLVVIEEVYDFVR
jgi:hypothetical protein